jgi:glutamate formiminotransferase/formiminotetrahydrofolate cyclodeaminase
MQGGSPGVPEAQVIETAIQSLGLREVAPFDPKEKIIEYRVAGEAPLADLTVAGFVDLTSTDAPAPGGGSVAALMGSLSGALAAMVANLTIGKKGYKEVTEEMKRVAYDAQQLKARFLKAVDDDTKAFDAVMDAMRMPRKTDDEIAKRDAAVEAATKNAIEVPLGVLRTCAGVLDVVEPVAERGNTNSASDAGVAALCARAGAGGAYLNVMINLPGISDEKYKKDTVAEAESILEAVNARAEAIDKKIKESLASQV